MGFRRLRLTARKRKRNGAHSRTIPLLVLVLTNHKRSLRALASLLAPEYTLLFLHDAGYDSNLLDFQRTTTSHPNSSDYILMKDKSIRKYRGECRRDSARLADTLPHPIPSASIRRRPRKFKGMVHTLELFQLLVLILVDVERSQAHKRPAHAGSKCCLRSTC